MARKLRLRADGLRVWIDDLQPEDQVFLDINTFVYYFLGLSQDCSLVTT
jgi:hypothetical protein